MRQHGISSKSELLAIPYFRRVSTSKYPVFLGPMIDSPVGTMYFSTLIEKFSRAALYAITMRGLRANWRFIFLYSYFLIIISPAIFFGPTLFVLIAVLALGRLTLASYIWFIITGEKRVSVECFLGDFLFFIIYIRSFIFRTVY